MSDPDEPAHFFDDEFDHDDEDDEDDALDECGLMDDGQCMLAGTEHCDFACPMRDSELFAGSAAWHAARARKPSPR